MKALALAVLACFALYGCNKPSTDEASADTTGPTAASPAGGGSGDDVSPVGPTAGPMTPVTGGENMGGTTGGGVAQGMKERARQTQGKASSATSGEDGE